MLGSNIFRSDTDHDAVMMAMMMTTRGLHTCGYTHVCLYVCMRVYSCAYTHAFTYTSIHVHMYVHTGGSAGGIGTFQNADWLSSRFAPGVVKASPQAGWYFVSPNRTFHHTLH